MGAVIPDSIRELIQAKCAELGYELFDCRFFQAGSRAVLRITIDAPSGVSIGDCERASHELSLLLDVEEFSAGRPYTLEVSSPGIDRPLKTERDFRRAVGRFVVLQMAPGYDGKKTLRVKVTGCAEGTIQCEIDGAGAEMPCALIASGKEELQFG
ncbi:MAG: ribosome maturation factor RimP [Chitinispirillaceae bacterium]|nr:ribosome maturation factor RimP [Chitinispirillaceae bacterium]